MKVNRYLLPPEWILARKPRKGEAAEVWDRGILREPAAPGRVLVAAGEPVNERGSALLESCRRVSA